WSKPAPGVRKRGIDWASVRRGGTEEPATYAFHVLVGHHGLFTLSPVWLLAVAGMGIGIAARNGRGTDSPPTPPGEGDEPGHAPLPWFLFPLTLGLTVVVVGFYLVQSDNCG